MLRSRGRTKLTASQLGLFEESKELRGIGISRVELGGSGVGVDGVVDLVIAALVECPNIE